MATVTDALGTPTASTTNAATYTSGSFSPTANGNLLVAFVVATGSTGTAAKLTDSQSLGFTLVGSAVKASSADTGYIFVANTLCTTASMTVTFATSSGANASGCIIVVAQVSGMTRTAKDATRQTAVQNNGTASTTPAPAFGSSALTGNPTLGAVFNATNPAGMTTPASWTERQDVGYANPATGGEYVSRDSGFTGTTVTWGSTSSAFCSLIIELDTSARPPDPLPFAIYPDQKVDKIQIIAY